MAERLIISQSDSGESRAMRAERISGTDNGRSLRTRVVVDKTKYTVEKRNTRTNFNLEKEESMSEETNGYKFMGLRPLQDELDKLTNELVEAKRILRENLTKYVNHQNNWSPEQFTDVYMRNIELVRAVRKKLSEARYKHNKHFLELTKKEIEDNVVRVENTDELFSNEKIDVTGFLSMSEAKVLFNGLYNFIVNKKDYDTFGLNVRVDGNDFFVTPVKGDAQ